MKRNIPDRVPEVPLLEGELAREHYKSRFYKVTGSTLATLVVVAALAILVATLWTPVLRIYGNSMNPTLQEGQYVISLKGADFEQGDLVSFYIGNKLLVKRVIASPGDWVDIKEDGTIYINEKPLDEPYIQKKAVGQCDLEFPYQVPESSYFLVGDQREISVDSRNTAVGCIQQDQIEGKIVFCVWPLKDFGTTG